MALPPWLDWARRLQAIAQNGLAYGRDPFDIARFEQVRALAAEIVAAHADLDLPAIEARFSAETGYATPKLDCRAVLIDASGHLLLVRERGDGLWTLPGGWVDVGESLSEAVEKEVREEAGLVVRAKRLLLLHDRDRHNAPPLPFAIWKAFVLCDIVTGEAAADGLETTEIAWCSPGAWPALSQTRTTAAQLERCLALAADPHAPCEFD